MSITYIFTSDLNDDGYRYNLLPYKQSHSGHIPTGTFFDRKDVLVDPTLIEVYDKYYKFSTVTNTSGDYMIFGATPMCTAPTRKAAVCPLGAPPWSGASP